MCKINIDNFVILKNAVDGIDINSIGLIQGLNGQSAMVYFIGKNKIICVRLQNIKTINIEKTGKGFDKKICNICHILKMTEEFDVNQTDAKGRKTTRPSCKKCRKDIDGVHLISSEKKRMNTIKPPKHSIFCCPICKKRTVVGITSNIVRDHDHKTGAGREWICDSCNTGLGRFKDNINFLNRAIEYLKKFN